MIVLKFYRDIKERLYNIGLFHIFSRLHFTEKSAGELSPIHFFTLQIYCCYVSLSIIPTVFSQCAGECSGTEILIRKEKAKRKSKIKNKNKKQSTQQKFAVSKMGIYMYCCRQRGMIMCINFN